MKKIISLVLLLTCSLTYAYRDTETGTFLTRDPIGYQDGPNLYCYVHCNPITQFDPLGLRAMEQGEFDEWVGTLNLQDDLEEDQFLDDDGNFQGKDATAWLQGKIGTDADGDFGTGSKLAAMRFGVQQRMDSLKDQGISGQSAKDIADMTKVMFGEFGRLAGISKDEFSQYANVVGWSIENRVGKGEWKNLTNYMDVISKSGYDAYTKNTPSHQIASWSFSSQKATAEWKGLANSMSIMGVASATSKLQTGIEASVDIQGNPAPAQFKDVTMYYSPAGMKPKGRIPDFVNGQTVEVPVNGVNPNYLKAYKYK